MLDRNEVLLGPLDRSAHIIEIGPSFCPVVPKAGGWNTTVLDHVHREELIKKYDGHPHVDVSRIEDVDIVWETGLLRHAFGPEAAGAYTGLVASHVIEHIPDLIGFFTSATWLLGPDGIIALAVPDKRLCFDFFRPVSTTGQVIARAGQTRHTAAALFDQVAYDRRPDNGEPSWSKDSVGASHLANSFDAAVSHIRDYRESPHAPYVDAHGWVFTLASFELLILELGAAGLIDWKIDWTFQRNELEFLVRLVPGHEQFASPQHREARRLALLERIMLETRDQIDWRYPRSSSFGPLSAGPSPRLEAGATAAPTPAASPVLAGPRNLLGPLRRTVARLRQWTGQS